ncbi:uncharacterized protein [Palaemon carinicauda]|uniref:uncharacterized protein n=1 Tax=Palaemon carinicauda TaxID=392227 RepID=UPI0035B66AF6
MTSVGPSSRDHSVTRIKRKNKILRLGLNCLFISRPKPTDKKLEVELLIDSILSHQEEGDLKTTDDLQPLLLAEALRDCGRYNSGRDSSDMREAARELRRADKTAAFTITEDFSPGYLYGNVKTHKKGNPLRPIISQCPTPTYHLAKRLNNLLTPYVPNVYSVTSSTEFLGKLKRSPTSGTIASLDVKFLFTNVPVRETMDLILERVYRDPSIPTLNIPEEALRTLLEVCTMKAPFTTHRGHTYIQKIGVVMGSPLCVLLANFYMGVVEERFFSLIRRPDIYVRYIKETFMMAPSTQNIETLHRTKDGQLPCLDVLISPNTTGFDTSVYIKPTNLGLCLNGDSECPTRYKASTIKAYACRVLSTAPVGLPHTKDSTESPRS